MRSSVWCASVCLAMGAVMGSARAQEPSILARITGAIDLPRVVEAVRQNGGIPEEEIRIVLEDVIRRGIPAAEASEVLEDTDQAIREHGPVDNFGAFVQTQLAAGLRGRDLAQAIRAEHQRRGIGQGRKLDRGASKAGGAAQATGAQKGQAGEKGQGAEKGQSGQKGRRP